MCNSTEAQRNKIDVFSNTYDKQADFTKVVYFVKFDNLSSCFYFIFFTFPVEWFVCT